MARGLVERGRRVLHSLLEETVVFVAGVEMAEAHPEASLSLAKTCVGLIREAMRQLPSLKERDVHIEQAYKELEVARDLFQSIVTGEPFSLIAMKAIPKGVEGRSVLILDIAHSHVHRAIDLLMGSETFETYHEPLRLLSEARRASAPTTLYRLAYGMARARS